MASASPVDRLRDKIARLQLVHRVGVALGKEQDKDRLIEMILLEAKKLCQADGGTLYLRTDDDHLQFVIMRTDSLGIALGGTTGKAIELPPIPLRDQKTGAPNTHNVATHAANVKETVHVPDAYHAEGFDFSGTKIFDERNGYRSKSLLTVPMIGNRGDVIGVLQLLNAQDDDGQVMPFDEEDQAVVEALAAQAGVALDNQLLLEGQKELLESFIKMIAAAIDAKSPYTGGHCERVPVLTEMITRSVCDATEGPFADFDLGPDEWYELRIAAWMHDCGKVTTPVHVMDKATKLETIADRIGEVRARFEVLKRDAEIEHLKQKLAGADVDDDALTKTLATLDEELAFLEKSNVGGEFLPQEAQDKIRDIGKRTWVHQGASLPLLSDDELENLTISRGTLTEPERLVINGHMVQTIKMLEALPFPKNLMRVPEYAGGHHEKMDGSGYPKGIYAGDMSVPARIMAIADVFEALTAQDRPYKKGKTLSESMRIMGFMKKDGHLDPALFDHFVRSGIYREYGARYLPKELIDDVDEQALLDIVPTAFTLPAESERKKRWQGFLPQYEA